MTTTPFFIDDSIPLVDLVRGLASVGLTVTGDRKGGLVVTTPERSAQFHGRDLRAACSGGTPHFSPEAPSLAERAARIPVDDGHSVMEIREGAR